MHNFWHFFLKKRQFTYLIIAAIVIFGVIAYVTITKESTPEIKIPYGIVSTVYVGASGADVEKLVTNKIEDGLNNLDNVSKITSSSVEGVSVVVVEFQASADIDKSIQKLKDQVDKIKPDLPDDANDPQVTDINFSDQPILIISVSSELPATSFSTLAEDLKDEIKSIPSVSKVELSGSRDRQVQVIVDKGKLNNYGLSIGSIISAISAANASLPAGDINVNDIKYSLKFQGDITDPEQVKSISVPGKNGQLIYIRDVADVYNGVSDVETLSRFSLNGKPAVQSLTLSVYKKSGGDITVIGDAIKTRLNELKNTTLKGSDVLVSFDQSQMIKDDLFHLFRSGLETVFLIMIVLFLTIGWREAVIAGLSVPLSFLIAFIGLKYTGNTVNFISLFSLILAIGILVDSGIVVVESIYTRYKRNHDKILAAHETIDEYSWPLIAGTMTTVAVFIPLFFLSGIVGKFIASIPYTTIFVLIASIFVALALVPIMTILAFKKKEGTESKFEAKQNEYTDRLQVWYREKLSILLNNRIYQNRFIWGLIIAFVLTLTFPMIGLVQVIFFPQSDVDYLYINIEKPKGTVLEKTDLAVRSVEEELYSDPRIESFITTVGSGSSFGESRFGGANASGGYLANITVNLKKDRKENSTEILESLKKKLGKIKSADVSVMEPSNGPPVGTPVAIKFMGDNLDDLNRVSEKAVQIMEGIEGTREVSSSAKDELPDFVLTLNRDRAAQFGLNSLTVAQTLRSSVYGVSATKIRENGKDVDVFVKANLNPTNDSTLATNNTVLEAVNQLPITTTQGTVLLGSLLDDSLKRGNSTIQHEDGKRLITVSSYLTSGHTSSEITNAFMSHKKELGAGPDIEISTGGENKEMNKTFLEMLQALILGVILMMIILVLEFNSFRYAFYTLMIVPLSLIGVFIGLAITRQAMSFPSILGFIALAGVIVNHTILLIDSIHKLRERNPEADMKELVIEAASVRLRPIMLTTITTCIGMIPLVFVNAMWGPLAFTVMFGLGFSVILTLGLVPLVNYRWPGRGRT